MFMFVLMYNLGVDRFQKMEQGCRKDLESLKSARRHGDPLPKFHYETRSFSIVQLVSCVCVCVCVCVCLYCVH